LVLITNRSRIAYELSIGTKIGRAVLFAVAELLVTSSHRLHSMGTPLDAVIYPCV